MKIAKTDKSTKPYLKYAYIIGGFTIFFLITLVGVTVEDFLHEVAVRSSIRDLHHYILPTLIGCVASFFAHNIWEGKNKVKIFLKKLRDSQEKFRNIFYKNSSVCLVINPDTAEIIDANNAALKYYGYNYSELTSLSISQIVVLSKEDIELAFQSILNSEKESYQFQHKLKSGEIRDVEVYSTIIESNNSTEKLLFSFIYDITERVKTEALNKMLKHSLDVFTDGIYWLDSENKFVYINKAGGKAFGCKPEELLGKPLAFVNPTTTPESLADLWHKLRTEGIFIAETVHRRLDGTEFFVEIRTVHVNYEGKEYYNGFARDITERKLAEKELIEAKEEAEKSNRLKTAFIQNLSHEFRTPMNAIIGFSELLFDYFDDRDKLRYFTDIIKIRSNDLLNIINDILDISKIESGTMTVNREECNAGILLDDLLSFFREQQNLINKKNITLSFKTDDDLDKISFLTDTVKLKQILINLIGNSLKFTEQGSITYGCKIKNEKILFYVADTGIGIPSDKFEDIFERFTQLRPMPEKVNSGTGLGLSIVKAMVQLLGGEIWLESDVGKGTTFYFTINLERNETKASKTISETAGINKDNKNKTVLIVEDDFYNSEFLKEVFALNGFQIITTNSGREAIKIATEQPIDVILMDIRLPDINGYEASKSILNSKPNMKIIAQTAYSTMDEKNKAISMGFVDYISKPIKRNQIIKLTDKILSAQQHPSAHK